LVAIAQRAIKRRTGARGLRSIVEQALLDTMYSLPSQKDIKRVVVDETAITGKGAPLMIREGDDKKAEGGVRGGEKRLKGAAARFIISLLNAGYCCPGLEKSCIVATYMPGRTEKGEANASLCSLKTHLKEITMSASQMLTLEPTDLPLLPLRDVVVFPHMVIPLFVGRPRSIKALELAMEAGNNIMLVAQKFASKDDPTPDDLYEIGCAASILQMLKLPDGTVKVLVEGTQRARIVQVSDVETHFVAQVVGVQ